jgi:hypothetical protein
VTTPGGSRSGKTCRRPVPKLDQQSSLKAEEELVGVVVLVPDEVTLELYDLDLIIVQFTDDLRPPMFGNSGQFLL